MLNGCLPGLDVVSRERFLGFKGLTIGLVTHPAAVDSKVRHNLEICSAATEFHLGAIFGPEHGFFGEAQDLIGVDHLDDRRSGFRVHSLYGDSYASLKPTSDQLHGIDALVIDLQDVGSRYYTFVSTMFFCLEAASENKLLAVVLDRPNPNRRRHGGGPDSPGALCQLRRAGTCLHPTWHDHGRACPLVPQTASSCRASSRLSPARDCGGRCILRKRDCRGCSRLPTCQRWIPLWSTRASA